jgi:hypothetical protein
MFGFPDSEYRERRVELGIDGEQDRAPELVDASEWQVLGEIRPRPTMAGTMFVRIGEREFQVGQRVFGSQAEEPKRSPRSVILKTIVPVPGQKFGRTYELRHAIEVDPGTYIGRLVEVQAAAAAKAEREARGKQPRLIDVAELFDILDRTPTPIAAAAEGPLQSMRSLFSQRRGAVLDVLAVQRAVEGRKQVRGIHAIRAFIESQGVKFSIVDGRLLATGTAMSLGLHAVISAFAPLLSGLVAGDPVPCALKHDRPVPAWSFAVPAVPVCQAHLEDEGIAR